MSKDEPTDTGEAYDWLLEQEHSRGCTCENPPMVPVRQPDGTTRAVLGHFDGCPRAYALEHRN
jgi:hypothetical protein